MDKNENAVAIFDKRANEYQDKYMDQDLYHDSFDLFCGSIAKENADILDIACGPGNITSYLLKKRPDFKILGIDLSLNMLDLAERNNPDATFQLMDCKDIGSIARKYDGIMCGFCLPYLSKGEAIKLISDISYLLTEGGVFYLSTMEDDYSKSGLTQSSAGDQLYIHYHQADYLTASLRENGFEILDLQRQDYPNSDNKKTTDLLILASK